MKKRIDLIALVTALLTSGCASTGYEPVLDGVRSDAYSSDLSACRELANEHRDVAALARKGALVGAGVGAVIGLADDDSTDGEDALAGAAIGAAVGGLSTLSESKDENNSMVFECMRGRGHRVIG